MINLHSRHKSLLAFVVDQKDFAAVRRLIVFSLKIRNSLIGLLQYRRYENVDSNKLSIPGLKWVIAISYGFTRNAPPCTALPDLPHCQFC